MPSPGSVPWLDTRHLVYLYQSRSTYTYICWRWLFCESGNTGDSEGVWSLTDPVWDSQGCVSGSTYCDRGGPWFNTTLSQEASDDVELRWCHSNKDVYIR